MFAKPYSWVLPFIVIGTIVFITATPAQAQVQRLVWEHAGGSMKDQGGGNWVEVSPQGVPSYRWREVSRNPEFIEAYDAVRGYTGRMYNNAFFIKGGNENVGAHFDNFTKFYDGRWSQ
jgi:hypothetical protein